MQYVQKRLDEQLRASTALRTGHMPLGLPFRVWGVGLGVTDTKPAQGGSKTSQNFCWLWDF